MVEPICGVPEERWVDWHLGRLSRDAAEALRRHMDTCPDCARVWRQWGELLDAPMQGQEEKTASGLPAEPPWDAEPPERLRRKLRRRLIRRRLGKQLAHKPLVSAAGVFAALVAAAVWLSPFGPGAANLAGGNAAVQRPAVLSPLEYARLHEPHGARLMQAPDTVMFTGAPAFAPGWPDLAPNGSVVIVWANPRTGEIFVLMDGLLPAESRDVQVWGLSGRQMTNLGLLKFHQWQGHLYSQVYGLLELEELYLTIEPKGGSLQPTAPETARLRLFAGP